MSPYDLDQGIQLSRDNFRPEFRSLNPQFNDTSASLYHLLKSHKGPHFSVSLGNLAENVVKFLEFGPGIHAA